MKKLIALFSLLVLFQFQSCDVAKQLVGTYALTQCKYDYNSISGLTLAGINLQNAGSTLNLANSASLLSAFSSSSGSLPLSFTLNLDVSNSGAQTAILNGANYILEIDGLEMTQGLFSQQLQVLSGGKSMLPIAMAFDLKKVMSGQSLDAIKNLAFNFAGIGNSSSKVTVKLKPSFILGGNAVSLPDYIPVSFTLNNK